MSKIPFIKAKHAQMKLIEGGGGGTNLELLSIYIDTPPEKTDYSVGDTFTLSGLKVIATFSEGYYRDVTENITCSISEGHVFVADEEGAEDVVLTYTQDGITKQTSFEIDVVNTKTVNYAFELHGYRASYLNKTPIVSHIIPVENIDTIKLSGEIYGQRIQGTGSGSCYFYIIAAYSTSEFVDSTTQIGATILSNSIAMTDGSTRRISVNEEIDVNEIFANYDDREHCYILAYLQSPQSAYFNTGASMTCEVETHNRALKLITKLANVCRVSEYSRIDMPSQSQIATSAYKIKISTLGYGQDISRYAYLINGDYSLVETAAYTSATGTYSKDVTPLSDSYDLTKPYRWLHAAHGTNSSATSGAIIYTFEIK